MPTVLLSDRSVIGIGGAEAMHFVQNLITADVERLPPDTAMPGALLTPQGKILFDFLVSRDGGDGFLLECRSDVADDLVRRLMLYRLRAKVEIAKRDESLVAVSWQSDSPASQGDSATPQAGAEQFARVDGRFPAELRVTRRFGGELPPADAEAADWHALRIRHGVAESGTDYALGEAFPHDVLLDRNGGVSFAKGCFVGQEVVSRMQHRGTARRRILIAEADADLPPPGTEITAGGRGVGTLGTVSSRRGLALARTDRVADAVAAGTPVLAGSVALRLALPEWTGLELPAKTSPREAG